MNYLQQHIGSDFWLLDGTKVILGSETSEQKKIIESIAPTLFEQVIEIKSETDKHEESKTVRKKRV